MVEDCPLERNQKNAVIGKEKKGCTVANYRTVHAVFLKYYRIKFPLYIFPSSEANDIPLRLNQFAQFQFINEFH